MTLNIHVIITFTYQRKELLQQKDPSERERRRTAKEKQLTGRITSLTQKKRMKACQENKKATTIELMYKENTRA